MRVRSGTLILLVVVVVVCVVVGVAVTIVKLGLSSSFLDFFVLLLLGFGTRLILFFDLFFGAWNSTKGKRPNVTSGILDRSGVAGPL